MIPLNNCLHSRSTDDLRHATTDGSVWKGRQIQIASRGQIDTYAAFSEIKGKAKGTYVIRDSHNTPGIKEFCYVTPELGCDRISVRKDADYYRIYAPQAFVDKKFTTLEDLVHDPDIIELLRRPLIRKRAASTLPDDPVQLEPDLFSSPAHLTLLPAYKDHISDETKELYAFAKTIFNKNKEVKVAFDDNLHSITFFHNEREIATILEEENLSHLCTFSLTLTRTDLTFCGALNYVVDPKSRKRFLRKLAFLQETAGEFIRSKIAKNVFVDQTTSLDTLVFSLLNDQNGFCLGERHSNAAAKEFIIKNLAALKKAGVTTLFMEHLFYDSSQMWLNSYHYAPPDAAMPRYLEAYLKKLAQGQSNGSPCYNFYEVVKAAKKAGIRVVALDTTVSYLAGGTDKQGVKAHQRGQRCLAMNYVASQIILHETKGGKFVAFMGSAHVGTMNEILGVASILGCPSMVIEEYPIQTSMLTVNVKNLHDEVDHVSVYLQVPKK